MLNTIIAQPLKMFQCRWYYLLFFVMCLVGCGSDKADEVVVSADSEAVKEKPIEPVLPEPYIDVGDIDALKVRGQVRILAPRFDTSEQFPRSGVPAQEYQQLAEQFIISQGLKPVWVFADGYDTLLNDLNEGRADLIVTNLSVTKARKSKVAFSVALATVDEILITNKNNAIDSLKNISKMSVAVREGTAYQETLTRLQKKYPDLTVEIKAGGFNISQLLQLVESGSVGATIVDSDMADFLIEPFPGLVKGPKLKKHRKIAWATRKDSVQLRQLLNGFLVAEHIQSGHQQKAHRGWEQIKAQKKLRVLTLNNPASYFMWRGELMGFDYDLMKKFAKRHKLRLEVVVKDDIDSLILALKQGEGDVIASSLTVTADREKRGVIFSHRYMNIREQIVGLADGIAIESVEELAGKRVAVNPQTAFYKRLVDLKASGIDFQIIEKSGAPTETLIAGLNRGEYDFTVADSHLVAIEKSYRDNLKANVDLTQDVDIAWGLRADQPVLLEKLNSFIKKEYRGLFYNLTFNKYFVNSKNIKRHKKFRVIADGVLSPFDKTVKNYAQNYTLDWRLITAQIYQESKFNPKAKSFAGAQGLMQVMPRTAQQFGFENLYEPDTGIAAGLAYMDWLHDRFPGSLSLDERLYFVLAAYNAGAGHVRDARSLARQLGKDPNRWFDNVEDAMLLLSQPDYAKKARFGYVRGSEPVQYVRNIRDRYLAYLNVANIEHEQQLGLSP